jgi:hypothetical protein
VVAIYPPPENIWNTKVFTIILYFFVMDSLHNNWEYNSNPNSWNKLVMTNNYNAMKIFNVIVMIKIKS